MKDYSELYIGLMSGTSADSIDAVLVDFQHRQVRLLAALSQPFAPELKNQILALYLAGDNEIDRLGPLDRQLGQAFAQAALAVLQKSALEAPQINAIGSHGQTIRHRPRSPSGSAFTLQIGDPNTIAQITGITTVADFRRRDVATGGQGAPLTPAFHRAFFGSPHEARCILNIGGIANITYLPVAGPAVGFDTGPGNGLMDAWIEQNLGHDCDRNGQWAASGTVHEPLLNHLLSHPFFNMRPPKSTGREEFSRSWLDEQLAAKGSDVSPADIQATLAELTAVSIANAITRLCDPATRIAVCGGGTHNIFLMDRLQKRLPSHLVSSTSTYGLDPNWVEATAFAWLARQTMNGLTGNLPDVTGAAREVVLGGIYPASHKSPRAG